MRGSSPSAMGWCCANRSSRSTKTFGVSSGPRRAGPSLTTMRRFKSSLKTRVHAWFGLLISYQTRSPAIRTPRWRVPYKSWGQPWINLFSKHLQILHELMETAMVEARRARAVGFNHVALEVGDIDEALYFYGCLFETLFLWLVAVYAVIISRRASSCRFHASPAEFRPDFVRLGRPWRVARFARPWPSAAPCQVTTLRIAASAPRWYRSDRA